MSNKRIQTCVRFKPELLRKVSCLAKLNRRSLSNQLEFLAMECVKAYEKENGELPVDPDDVYK